jgi:four helix bundle protein
MKTFRCYTISLEVYRHAQALPLPAHLKRQLLRAASSVCLNFSEGWGREAKADRRHFFTIAFGSVRECQSIAALAGPSAQRLAESLDVLAASTWRLLHPRP